MQKKNQIKVQFLQSRWFENVEGQFDIIVSNPPYIDETDEHLFQGDVRFEPRSALVAGENGLADLRHLIEHAPGHLKDNRLFIVRARLETGRRSAVNFLAKSLARGCNHTGLWRQ